MQKGGNGEKEKEKEKKFNAVFEIKDKDRRNICISKFPPMKMTQFLSHFQAYFLEITDSD